MSSKPSFLVFVNFYSIQHTWNYGTKEVLFGDNVILDRTVTLTEH